MRPSSPKAPAPALRRRAARAADALERAFGSETHVDDGDPLDCLIHCILSQNTTAANCRRAYERLRAKFPTWKDALAARPREIEQAIRVGGLGRQKSRWIKGVLQWLERERGELSLEFIREQSNEDAIAMLTSLPGVGLKTAAIVLCFGCGRDVFPVDTHVHRVCRRLGLAPSDATREATFWIMAQLVPRGRANSFHLNLVHLGRTVCRARRPRCDACPLRRMCPQHA